VIKKHIEVVKVSIFNAKCVYINHYLFKYQFSSFFDVLSYITYLHR